MIYRKNLYSWEQILRIVAGIGLAIYAALGLAPGLIAYGVGAGGVVLALTGIFGWCPMCAVAGRKLNKPS